MLPVSAGAKFISDKHLPHPSRHPWWLTLRKFPTAEASLPKVLTYSIQGRPRDPRLSEPQLTVARATYVARAQHRAGRSARPEPAVLDN